MNAEKIGKLIKLLSSINDGEVVAAARAILRTLEAEGADIHELAERVEGRKLSQAEMQTDLRQGVRDGKKPRRPRGLQQRRRSVLPCDGVRDPSTRPTDG